MKRPWEVLKEDLKDGGEGRGLGVVVWEAQGSSYSLDYHQMHRVMPGSGTLVNKPHTGTHPLVLGNLSAGASVKLIPGVSTNQ